MSRACVMKCLVLLRGNLGGFRFVANTSHSSAHRVHHNNHDKLIFIQEWNLSELCFNEKFPYVLLFSRVCCSLSS